MITTYYIVGYSCYYPFIRDSTRRKIDRKEISLNTIPYLIKLILINVNTGCINELGYGKLFPGDEYSNIFHSFSKRSNFFKMCRAIFGIRDPVKTCINKIYIDDFIDNYVSYNDITRKFVKASESRKLKLGKIDMDGLYALFFNPRIKEFFLLPSLKKYL